MIAFTAHTHENRFLPPGGSEVSAVVTVSRAGTAGSIDAVAPPAASVSLRLWTAHAAKVLLLKQVAPTIDDLTGMRLAVSDAIGEYRTGVWSEEQREYFLRIAVEPQDVGDEMVAARVDIVDDEAGEIVARTRLFAEWTDDDTQSTPIDPEVARHIGQTDMADAIRVGIEARRRGDEKTAMERLEWAWELATSGGHQTLADLLAKMAGIEDSSGVTEVVRKRVLADESPDDASAPTMKSRPKR